MIGEDSVLGYPIRRLAADLGLVADSVAKDTFFAPGRDEKTASLKLYPEKQQWRDYGAGKGGFLLDLILYCRPELDCPVVDENGNTVSPKARAMAFLKQLCGSGTGYVPVPRRKARPQSAERRVLVENWRPDDDRSVTDASLLEYAARRCWDEDVTKRYCSQITVSIKGTDYRHVLLGFPNIDHGYVLRGPGRFGKISTNQAVSVVSADGLFTVVPASRTLLVFEGFGNFLAYLSHHILLGDGSVIPGGDVLVLNSWQNVSRPFAREYAQAHDVAYWYGDNDEAGYKAFSIFEGWGACRLEDRVQEYARGTAVDDYNDFLVAWCKDRGNNV